MKLSLAAFSAFLCALSLQAQSVDSSAFPKTDKAQFAEFQNSTAQGLFIEAQDAEAKQDFNDAADAYSKLSEFATNRKNKAQATVSAANNYLKAQQLDMAHNFYVRALENYATLVNDKTITFTLFTIADAYADKVIKHKAAYESAFIKGLSKGLFVNYQKAIESYQKVVELAPYDKRSPNALLRVAELQELDKESEEAEVTYISITKRYRTHAVAADARLALAKLYLKNANDSGRDRLYIIKAYHQIKAFRSSFPQHAKIAEVNKLEAELKETQAQKAYQLAVFYTKKAHARPAASKRYLKRIITHFADTSYKTKAEALLNKLNNVKTAPTGKTELAAKVEMAKPIATKKALDTPVIQTVEAVKKEEVKTPQGDTPISEAINSEVYLLNPTPLPISK